MFDFLTLKPEAFGLDFSDSSLKITKLKKIGKNLKLASFGEILIRPGVIKNGEIKNKEILVKTIKKAVSEVKGERIKTKYVNVSLPEEKAFLEVIQMPKTLEEDLKSAVVFEAEDHVPMPIEEVCLDAQIVPAVSDHLDHQDVLLVAFPKKIIYSYIDCLEEAGFVPAVFEIESLAASRSLIKNEISNRPILMIDFGATTTSFAIFSGYSIRFTFSIDFSPRNLTEAVARSMKIDLVQAEKLKLKYSSDLNKNREEDVYRALSNSFAELIEQVKKHLDYYYTHIFHEHLPDGERAIKKVLIYGGGANLKGLDSFLSQELALPVEFANPWVNILSKNKKEKAGLSLTESLKYVTALGLALRGIKN